MLNNALEAVGCFLVVVFFWFVWPPLVLLAAGVLLVLVAVVRDRRPTDDQPKGGIRP